MFQQRYILDVQDETIPADVMEALWKYYLPDQDHNYTFLKTTWNDIISFITSNKVDDEYKYAVRVLEKFFDLYLNRHDTFYILIWY